METDVFMPYKEISDVYCEKSHGTHKYNGLVKCRKLTVKTGGTHNGALNVGQGSFPPDPLSSQNKFPPPKHYIKLQQTTRRQYILNMTIIMNICYSVKSTTNVFKQNLL